MREFGWTIPVLVDEGGELIAGHGRLRAARLLGLDDAPVLVAKGWSEAQKRAYRIADNKLALNSGWDTVLLSGELAALAGEGLAADLLGFSDADMARLVDDTDRLTLEHAAAAAAAVDPTDWRHAAAQPDTGPHIDASAPRQTDYGRSFADKNHAPHGAVRRRFSGRVNCRSGIHVAGYLTTLPPRAILVERLHQATQRAQLQIEQCRNGIE